MSVDKDVDRCAEFATQLWLYLDGSLPPDEREIWDAHLFNCKQCARELAAIRKTLAAYRALPGHDVADTVFDRAVRQAVNPPPNKPKVLSKRRLVYWAVPLAAAAALLLFIFIPGQKPQYSLEWQTQKIDYDLAVLEDDIYRIESSELPMIGLTTDDFAGTVLDADLQQIEQRIAILAEELASNL
jgi:hypothetical protein